MTTVIWKAELLDEDGLVISDEFSGPHGVGHSGGLTRFSHARKDVVEHWVFHETMHLRSTDKRTWRIVKVEETVESYHYPNKPNPVVSNG